MFLRCRNRPLLPSVAWGGRTHAAPQERGKIRGSPTRFPPRAAGARAGACVRRRSATDKERAPTPPPPARAGRPRPQGRGRAPGGKRVSPGGVGSSGDCSPACGMPPGGPPRQGRGGGGAGVQPLPHPSPPAMVKCAFQGLGQTRLEGRQAILASD